MVRAYLGGPAKQSMIASSVGIQLKSNYAIIFTQLPTLHTSVISALVYSQ